MVGSSWKSAEMRGLAPTMSPAATVSVLAWLPRNLSRWFARKATPPASTVTGAGAAVPTGGRSPPVATRPPEPDGGSRLPCRSLMASSWSSTVFGALGGVGVLDAADAGAPIRVSEASPSRPARPAAATRGGREVRDMRLLSKRGVVSGQSGHRGRRPHLNTRRGQNKASRPGRADRVLGAASQASRTRWPDGDPRTNARGPAGEF